MRKLLAIALILTACATPGPPTQPNDREWNLIAADYQWLDSLRTAQPKAPAGASRKQQIVLFSCHDAAFAGLGASRTFALPARR